MISLLASGLNECQLEGFGVLNGAYSANIAIEKNGV